MAIDDLQSVCCASDVYRDGKMLTSTRWYSIFFDPFGLPQVNSVALILYHIEHYWCRSASTFETVPFNSSNSWTSFDLKASPRADNPFSHSFIIRILLLKPASAQHVFATGFAWLGVCLEMEAPLKLCHTHHSPNIRITQRGGPQKGL